MKRIRNNQKQTKKAAPDEASLHETIYSNGEEHYSALLADIAQAQNTIDFESYIFSNDSAGQLVANALIQAIERGVDVRVLVDGVGSPFWGSGLALTLEKAGAQTKIYNPFPWQVWNWSRSTRRHWLIIKWLYLMFYINRRNHRKTAIIDHKIAYVGSFNVHRCHLPKNKGGFNWRDTSVRITGTNLSDLTEEFERTWHHKPIRNRIRDAVRRIKTHHRFKLNTCHYSRRILLKQLLRRFSQSHQCIWLTCAYFVPSARIIRRLKEAAKRGVDVKLLLPKKSDHFIMDWVMGTYYKSLLSANIKIFVYKPSVLHAKSLIIDDWMMVGSTNLNSRSLLHDLEADVELKTIEAQERLKQLFLADLSESDEITLANHHIKVPLYKRALGLLIAYFRYWI